MVKLGLVSTMAVAILSAPAAAPGQATTDAVTHQPVPTPLPPKLPEVKPALAQSTGTSVSPHVFPMPPDMEILLLQDAIQSLRDEVNTLKANVAALQARSDQALYLPKTSQGAPACYQSGLITLDDLLYAAPAPAIVTDEYTPPFAKSEVLTIVECPALATNAHP